MSQKTFNFIAGIFFTLGGLLHLIRSIVGWEFSINNWNIPIGVSVIAFLLATFLAYSAFKLNK